MAYERSTMDAHLGARGQQRRDLERAWSRVMDQTRALDEGRYGALLARACVAMRRSGLQVVELGAGLADLLEGAWARIEPDGEMLLALYRAETGAERITLLALCHEWSHAVLHWRKRQTQVGVVWRLAPRREATREVEAELATCLVAESLGVAHPGGGDYLLAWDRSTPARARTRALAAAARILDAMAEAATLEQGSSDAPDASLAAVALSRRARSRVARTRVARTRSTGMETFVLRMREELAADARLGLLPPRALEALLAGGGRGA
jgi:hypothetical protein